MPPETPITLTTADLFASIRTLRPKIAVFDCDGTLWSGDAGSSFMWWSMKNGLLPEDRTLWLKGRYDEYRRGEISEIVICGEMVQVYHSIEIKTLRAAAADFFREHVEPNIFPEMASLIAELQQNDVDIWAVSSTCDWVINEGVKRFNILPHRVLAARVEAIAGVATNRLLDVPTDEGKVASLQRVGITAPDIVFGNSIHDAAMLAIARRAYPVNPSPGLIARAAAEGWPVYYPASVAP